MGVKSATSKECCGVVSSGNPSLLSSLQAAKAIPKARQKAICHLKQDLKKSFIVYYQLIYFKVLQDI